VQEPKPEALQLKPKVPVPERVKVPFVPKDGVTVTMAAFEPAETGLKVIAPEVQVCWKAKVAFAQVP
jgi:hypothetical protein